MAIRDTIFISYSHENTDFAQRFRKMLESQHEIRVFSDAQIAQGEDWGKQAPGRIGSIENRPLTCFAGLREFEVHHRT